MKIRFLEDTFIRSTPETGTENRIGIALKSAEIDVEPVAIKGEGIESNDLWFVDKNGWFYWSGRAVALESPVAPTPTAELQPTPPSQQAPRPSDRPPTENIPPGETRLVPPLEDLLMMEQGFHAGPDIVTATATPVADTVTAAVLPQKEQPVPDIPPPDEPAWTGQAIAIEPQPASPQAIATHKLNWALRKYNIEKDWWQDRHLTGQNIRLALLSTGVAPDHPDLGIVEDWFQFQDSGQPMYDIHGLGTQAMVICAGAGEIACGIAPEVGLLIGKIGDQDHTIQPEGLIAGLEWAIGAKADIVAMLVDFPELNPEHTRKMNDLVKQAKDRGILLFAPVGNSENRKPESRYPAALDGVFSVGAHDQFAQKCSFSARSFQLDILAPGQGLLISGLNAASIDNAKTVSIAAAFAAGFSALVCQALRSMGQKSDPETVCTLLRETATARRNFNPGEDVEYGYGLLDPFSVLKRLDPNYAGPDK